MKTRSIAHWRLRLKRITSTVSGIGYLFVLLVLPGGCNRSTPYYYGKVNNGSLICKSDQYVVLEDLGDSLQIWELRDNCNSGFTTSFHFIVPRKAGKNGNFEVLDISDSYVDLQLDWAARTVNFDLARQRKPDRAWWVINVIQMQEIGEEMEERIDSSCEKADKDYQYLSYNLVADPMTKTMNPSTFSMYYRKKKETETQKIIKEICPR